MSFSIFWFLLRPRTNKQGLAFAYHGLKTMFCTYCKLPFSVVDSLPPSAAEDRGPSLQACMKYAADLQFLAMSDADRIGLSPKYRIHFLPHFTGIQSAKRRRQ
jgi:hypothetical protein